MKYQEIKGDLFTAGIEPIYVHCISSDFRMGKGIASQFTERGVKECLLRCYEILEWDGTGYALPAYTYDHRRVINLVTKEEYNDKPTMETMQSALEDLKRQIPEDAKLVMPKIGCGLDRLKWEDVKKLIFEIFEDTDIDITVYIKEK